MSRSHTSNAPESRCSQHREISYVWARRPAGKSSIEAAVDALMAAITTPGRRWNPYNQEMARAEFKGRLEDAERGILIPVEHVKELTRGRAAHLYEIRWQAINVTEVDARGRVRHSKTRARLQHAEPLAYPDIAVGVHAHEKIVVKGDDKATNKLQDAEIAKGVDEYFTQDPSDWVTSS